MCISLRSLFVYCFRSGSCGVGIHFRAFKESQRFEDTECQLTKILVVLYLYVGSDTGLLRCIYVNMNLLAVFNSKSFMISGVEIIYLTLLRTNSGCSWKNLKLQNIYS